MKNLFGDRVVRIKGKNLLLPEIKESPDKPHVISLGAGVQSSTMLFMAAVGEIKPMPTAAIFADTQAEPESVYRWLKWLQSQKLPFPILIRTKGDLSKENLRLSTSHKSGNRYVHSLIPLYIKNPDGTRGILPRRCTNDYKVAVIQRAIRTDILRARRIYKSSGVLVYSWIGISIDEADRMKPSRVGWIENRWPLIDREISRDGCIAWMAKHGFPRPPKSACRQCPYHSDQTWIRMKAEEPEEFLKAVKWERAYQKACEKQTGTAKLKGTPFVHNSLVPLSEVIFDPQKKSTFNNECEGMCGV